MAKTYKHLSSEDRVCIMLRLRDGKSLGAIARELERPTSCISREVARHKQMAGCQALPYEATRACMRAHMARFSRRRKRKLDPESSLFAEVRQRLQAGVSPDQIAGSLRRAHPGDARRTVSHEAIYTALYALPRGELRRRHHRPRRGLRRRQHGRDRRLPRHLQGRQLRRRPGPGRRRGVRRRQHGQHRRVRDGLQAGEVRRELIGYLRQGHVERWRRSRGANRKRTGFVTDDVLIHVRPPEVEDRLVPGHWEGDFIKGAVNRSAVGTLVERSSRFVLLAQMDDCSSLSALHGFSRVLRRVEPAMRKTMGRRWRGIVSLPTPTTSKSILQTLIALGSVAAMKTPMD